MQLGDALAQVPANDFLVMLGDMNARVGVPELGMVDKISNGFLKLLISDEDTALDRWTWSMTAYFVVEYAKHCKERASRSGLDRAKWRCCCNDGE